MKKKAQEKGWHLRLQLEKRLANSCLLLTQNVVGGCQVRPVITSATDGSGYRWLVATKNPQRRQRGSQQLNGRCKDPNTNSWMGGQAP